MERWAEIDGLTAGVDEVGRGPLAGPVVAAAVVLDPAAPRLEGLRDSKRIAPRKREQLSEQIRAQALGCAIGVAEVEEIDSINILQASLLAMSRAIDALPAAPRRLLVDGNRCPQSSIPAQAIVGGDDSVASISAASIVAKVYRDALMVKLDEVWPGYGFAAHKGYGTRQHMTALENLGACLAHRRSFAPVRLNLERAALRADLNEQYGSL